MKSPQVNKKWFTLKAADMGVGRGDKVVGPNEPLVVLLVVVIAVVVVFGLSNLDIEMAFAVSVVFSHAVLK